MAKVYERLLSVVFLRYPQLGRTKTRLISALGAEGAAQLQQEIADSSNPPKDSARVASQIASVSTTPATLGAVSNLTKAIFSGQATPFRMASSGVFHRGAVYYLIDLNQGSCRYQVFFQGIDWSTSKVFQQTQAEARQLNLSVAELKTLSDVNRPQDLAVWQQIQMMSDR